MTTGGFVMFFSEKLPLRKALPPVLLASALFGLSNVLAKFVYDRTNFVTGFVWFTIGGFVSALSLLTNSFWRRQIIAESSEDDPRNRFWYFVNRFFSGVGSFLVVYAISLTHPALVDAISGIRYVVIFIGAYLLTRFKPDWLFEDFHSWQLITKVVGTALVVTGVVIVGLAGSGSGGSSRASDELTPRFEQVCFARYLDRAAIPVRLRLPIRAHTPRFRIRPRRLPQSIGPQ
jgi:drug/metabolite transporter (DMT)-like permease